MMFYSSIKDNELDTSVVGGDAGFIEFPSNPPINYALLINGRHLRSMIDLRTDVFTVIDLDIKQCLAAYLITSDLLCRSLDEENANG